MTQTEVLGLNCWTDEDPVQVSQLSENFERLDQAQNVVKLLEAEDTVGGVTQIDVDLSGISLQDYRYLELEFQIAGLPTQTTPQCRVLLNNITTSVYYLRNTSDGSSTTTDHNYLFDNVYTPRGTPPFTDPNSADVYNRIRLWGTEYTIFAECMRSYLRSSQFVYYMDFGTVLRSAVTPSTLSSINFVCAQGAMEAGSWIKVYGVRK